MNALDDLLAELRDLAARHAWCDECWSGGGDVLDAVDRYEIAARYEASKVAA